MRPLPPGWSSGPPLVKWVDQYVDELWELGVGQK